MILLKTHLMLSKTQVPNSKIIQIMYSLQYYIFLIFFKRTNEPTNQASLNLKDRDFIDKWSQGQGLVNQCHSQTLESQHYNNHHPPSSCLAFPTVLGSRGRPRAVKGSHTEEYKHHTVITVCNRSLTESRSFCMQRDAVFCHAFVQSAERDQSVFCLLFGFQVARMTLMRMASSVLRRHIMWQYGL